MRDSDGNCLAVGFFDGVHLGHRAILAGADIALTFTRHPLSVVAPERAPRLIMSLDERLAAIRACGVREVRALDFAAELSALSPEDFVARHLTAAGVSAVRCGANWRFGRGGRGDAALLRTLGFAVDVAPYVDYKGGTISSSRIRLALEAGEIADANAMLGRPFVLTGRVFRGKGEGARLGYPTVNVRVASAGGDRVRLPRGVYAVEVSGATGIANYGVAPTMGTRAWPDPVLEVHFLGTVPTFAVDSEVSVALTRFVRPERHFASLEELQRQIAADCATISA